MFYVGRQYGLRVDMMAGAWLSVGAHIHVWPLREAHIDLHLLWLILTIGRQYAAAPFEARVGICRRKQPDQKVVAP